MASRRLPPATKAVAARLPHPTRFRKLRRLTSEWWSGRPWPAKGIVALLLVGRDSGRHVDEGKSGANGAIRSKASQERRRRREGRCRREGQAVLLVPMLMATGPPFILMPWSLSRSAEPSRWRL